MNLEKFWSAHNRGYGWAEKLLVRCEEKKLRFLALHVWYGEHNLPEDLCWNLIPWKSNLQEVILFIESADKEADGFSFLDVDLEKVKDISDDDENEEDYDEEDWYRRATYSELKRHTKLFKEKLAIRQKNGGCNADLELRSCQVPRMPVDPVFR